MFNIRSNHHRIRLFVFAVLLSCGPTGCGLFGQTADPLATAETVEQKAFVLYADFVSAEEIALNLMRDDSVPVDVKRKIQNADRLAKPLMDNLVETTLQVQRARMLLADAETLDAKLAALSVSLATAGPALARLLETLNDGER